MMGVGIVGARGYVGAELIGLLGGHAQLNLAYASSRALVGQAVGGGCGELRYEDLSPREVAARRAEVVVLALPNGLSEPFVSALSAADDDPLIIDLGADYRFDAAWHYGLPELYGPPPRGCRRISNPGCYATAMQLALYPIREWLVPPVACFGVSGYSGAGTAPSEKNDPEVLRDNLIPYAPIGHVHEREVARHLQRDVHFMPHVSAFFRGIGMTCDARLDRDRELDEIASRYREYYADQALIGVSSSAPRARDLAERPGAVVGGLAVDGRRLVVYVALDNLLKGAAVQALQNINLALGLNELEGIAHA